jgi:hypothetical protein
LSSNFFQLSLVSLANTDSEDGNASSSEHLSLLGDRIAGFTVGEY